MRLLAQDRPWKQFTAASLHPRTAIREGEWSCVMRRVGLPRPGSPGSPIDTDLFHAQILLDAAGFSPGAIDGKHGSSFKQALRGFQEGHGLAVSGTLDTPTRQALLKVGRPSAVMVKLGPD